MGMFPPIVQPALLLMRHRRQDFCLGCCVAAQLVGDDGTWDVLKAFQQLAKELLAGFLVPAWLHEDIKHVAILVDCTPEILQLAVDREKDFIEMPSLAEMMTFRTHPLGICPTGRYCQLGRNRCEKRTRRERRRWTTGLSINGQ